MRGIFKANTKLGPELTRYFNSIVQLVFPDVFYLKNTNFTRDIILTDMKNLSSLFLNMP